MRHHLSFQPFFIPKQQSELKAVCHFQSCLAGHLPFPCLSFPIGKTCIMMLYLSEMGAKGLDSTALSRALRSQHGGWIYGGGG